MNTLSSQFSSHRSAVDFYWSKHVWAILLLSALCVGLLLHADALVRSFHTSQDKVGVLISGPRTDVGDERSGNPDPEIANGEGTKQCRARFARRGLPTANHVLILRSRAKPPTS